jgi:O-methyltransferase
MLYSWQDDSEFGKIIVETTGKTLLGPERLYVLYHVAKHIKILNGAFAEVGVYKGGSARLIHKILEDSESFSLYDTFEGMPECNKTLDKHRKGDFKDTSYDNIRKMFKGTSVRIVKGFFPDSASDEDKSRAYSMVHIDCDIYQSVKDCCKFFYPIMMSGGIMVFDDYGFPSCPGAKRAVDEFFKDKKETPIYIPTGQCLVTMY